ncbi:MULTISPECIES: hypothetical protein [Pseudobacteroides]|uniref:Uncharacterized protein n=1 Tax=Pseudobacteroides cellulosolvens ATCC 35603 = DSM 2933 TaxID=398512 RepID=A0A0L6JUB1_9FIRM|nr:hypothetical protein [Pseudobacteroides cellulosolvens]KNY29017.1 hypothetical protein Bccel_4291 [Pseudobacteroides cellulosolvens ATCC 35603 = DSM 2933]
MAGHRNAAGEIIKIMGARDQKSTVAVPVRSEQEEPEAGFTDLTSHVSNPDAHHSQYHHAGHEDGGADTIAVSDSMIAERTIDDSSSPTGNTGLLTTLLGWLAAMVKTITGKGNWRTAPEISLQDASDHMKESGAHLHLGCRVAATANISLSGLQTIDGVSLSAGDRVLVKNQTDQKENGVYIVSSGSWARADDFNDSSDFKAGVFVYISEGTVNKKKLFHMTTAGTVVIGNTNIVFENIDQGGGAGSGDMTKSVYDPDEDGIVENAEHALAADNASHADTADLAGSADNASNAALLEGHPASYFAASADLKVYAADIDFYEDGVVITFSDSSTANYSWVKDDQGRITSLVNTTPNPDETTSISYNSGNKP